MRRKTSRAPRLRIVVALLIFALTWTVGLAWSDRSAPAPAFVWREAPEDLRVPVIHEGDHVTYAFRLEQRLDDVRVFYDEADVIDLRWHAAEEIIDADARLRRVNVLELAVRPFPSLVDDVPQGVGDICCADGFRLKKHLAYFDAATGDLVAQRKESVAHRSHVRYTDGALVVNTRWLNDTTFEADDHWYFGPQWHSVACWGPKAFHGGRLQDLELRTYAPYCDLGGHFFPSPMVGLARGDRLGDRECAVVSFANEADGVRASVWTCPDSPHPARIEVQFLEFQSLYGVYERTRLDPGDRPLTREPVSSAAPPAFTMDASQPWGPRESDVTHPFPLSEAYAHASRDPRLEGAFLTKAKAHPRSTDLGDHFEWELTLRRPGAAFDIALRLEANGTAPTVLSFESRPWNGTNYPSPATLPTVASLFDRWQRFAALDWPHLEPNSWVHTARTVGWRHEEWAGPVGTLTAANGTRREAEVLLHVKADGVARALEEHVEFDRAGPAQPGAVPAVAGGAMAPAPMTRSIDLETFDGWPPQRAVQAGLIAVAVGVFAYAVPSLYKWSAVVLFSRLSEPEALRHPSRARLLDVVAADPGVHFREIVRRTSMGRRTAEHHLRKLNELGLVSAHKSLGQTAYFLTGIDRRTMEASSLLRRAPARRLLEFVAAHPGANAGEAGRASGLHPSAASRVLRRLNDGGLLSVQRAGRQAVLRASPLGHDALARVSHRDLKGPAFADFKPFAFGAPTQATEDHDEIH